MCPPSVRLVHQEPSHPCIFQSSFPTCGLATTPSPSGFRVITAGTWARVINPSPCYNLARSVSSMVKVRGNKLGHVPVPVQVLFPHPRVLPLSGYGTLVPVGTARTPVRLQGLIPRSATPTNRSYIGERVFPKSQEMKSSLSAFFFRAG